MAIKRTLLVVLVSGILVLAVGGGQVRAQPPAPFAASATADSHLSGEIAISTVDNEAYLPSVAYNWKHHEYLVVWHTKWAIGTRDIRGARVSDTGQVLETFIVYEHATKDSAQPSVAYDPVNDRYLVVWIFDDPGNGSDWDLYGRFIPWDGPSASLTEFAICTWGTHQWNPKVAYGRAVEEFLVVWANEYQAGTPPMYISGRRVKAADGSFPGGSSSDLTISHTTQNRVNPDVTYNRARNEYLVVYDNAVDIFGNRWTGDLKSNFGEFGIAGWPDTEIHPAVAACPGVDQYLVVWQSTDSGTGDDAIYGRFLNGEAAPGNVHLIDNTTLPEREADVACNHAGTQYLVAWQTRYTNLKYGIWGRLVKSDETMMPPFSIVHPSSSTERTSPVVAGGHTNYLTAWEHQRDGTSYQDIHGRLFTPHVVFLPLLQRN